MLEYSKLDIVDKGGKPLLFMNGLGNKADMNADLRSGLQNLNFDISTLRREDEPLLSSDNPENFLQTIGTESIKHLSELTGKKVALAGVSLGSWQAVLAANQTADSIEKILLIDPFLTPDQGFEQIEDIMHEFKDDAEYYAAKGEALASPIGNAPQKFKEAPEGYYPVLLASHEWINLPTNLQKQFTSADLVSNVNNLGPIPKHLIWGDEDEFIKYVFYKDNPANLFTGPTSKLILPDTYHNEWVERPEAINSALEFMKSNN